MKIAFAMAHFGSQIPRHVILNAREIKKRFPDIDLYFISDNQKALKKLNDYGIKTAKFSETEELAYLRSIMGHNFEFRYGYWYHVMARFFCLDIVLEDSPKLKLIQIESDVSIMPNFPIDKFMEIEEEIAFPLYTQRDGVASVLFFNGKEAHEKFKKIMVKEFQKNSITSDMKILSVITNGKQISSLVLPSLPPCGHLRNVTLSQESAEMVERRFYFFEGCFDPLEYGQFLYGWDPRNNKGKRRVYAIGDQGQFVVPSQVRIITQENGLLIQCRHCEMTFPLFNLHIHSKDKRLFTLSGLARVSKKRNKHSKDEERMELTVNAISRRIKHLRDSLTRRIKRRFRFGA